MTVSRAVQGGKRMGSGPLTAGPSQHGHLKLSFLADDIHHILPPPQSPLGQLGPIILPDQQLLLARVLVIIDDPPIDPSS